MMNTVELIRLEVGDKSPQSLLRRMWPVTIPDRQDFLSYARIALRGFCVARGVISSLNPAMAFSQASRFPRQLGSWMTKTRSYIGMISMISGVK